MFLIKEILLTLDVNSDTISEKLFKLVFKMNNMGQQGTQEWQTEVFRSSLVRCSKLLLHGHCPLDSYRNQKYKTKCTLFQETGRSNQGKWEPNTEASTRHGATGILIDGILTWQSICVRYS